MKNLSIYSDDELVQLYQKGCDEAFDELLNRYKNKLYSYIYYAIRNNDLADDIFQETFVKAIVTIKQDKYSATGKFYPWLVRISHNLIIDQFRNEQSENTISNDEVERDLYGSGAVSDNCMEREHEAENSLQEVCRLMDRLPENQREMVDMRIFKNMSFKDIAEQKNMSINTALGRMRYAILNMRRMAEADRLRPYIC